MKVTLSSSAGHPQAMFALASNLGLLHTQFRRVRFNSGGFGTVQIYLRQSLLDVFNRLRHVASPPTGHTEVAVLHVFPFFIRERRGTGMSGVTPQEQEWKVLSIVLHGGTISAQTLSGMQNLVKDT
jgi:hypothetical protein